MSMANIFVAVRHLYMWHSCDIPKASVKINPHLYKNAHQQWPNSTFNASDFYKITTLPHSPPRLEPRKGPETYEIQRGSRCQITRSQYKIGSLGLILPMPKTGSEIVPAVVCESTFVIQCILPMSLKYGPLSCWMYHIVHIAPKPFCCAR